ncbi:hypothetical protein BEP19_03265 [Ammoniphilus oxalaticus]|uniref:ABC transmembrane type-1 domain-containing protein n=1 Tax=Ammoniphilus oxalaticus TaxID=66863 RepID=A0A419SNU8_9BACL|nr:carbohydrate ABC transporter permease [Ammoniphilus oxalaticus]RKD25958.1 hypothetical protein BEP19_03265 [Ammoniphilus oxalaticus]
MKKVAWYLGASIFGLLLIFPFLWMVSTSLKPSADVLSLTPVWIPRQVTIQPYLDVIGNRSFRGYLFNSLGIATVSSVISAILASLAGYAFSRIPFRGREGLLTFFLSSQAIPSVVLLIPIFSIMTHLHLKDSLIGLILAYISFSLPFCTWIMVGYYKRIPLELEEAAFMDGASRWSAFWRVIFPISLPGMISTGIFSFLLAWDEFLFAITLTQSESKRTLPYGLYNFMGQYGVEWNQLMAAAVLAMIPPSLIFLFLHRYFVSGFTSGATKE